MIGIVIVAHGGLAREYLAAVEHVVGPQAAMRAIAIEDTHAHTYQDKVNHHEAQDNPP